MGILVWWSFWPIRPIPISWWFSALVSGVVRAPMRWWDTTPLGRVLNRFSFSGCTQRPWGSRNIRAGGSPDEIFNMKSHNSLRLPMEKRSLMIQKMRSKLGRFLSKCAFRLGFDTPCRATWHFLVSLSVHFRQVFGSSRHQTFVLVSGAPLPPNVNMPPPPPHPPHMFSCWKMVILMLIYMCCAWKTGKREMKHGIPWRSCFPFRGHIKMKKLLAGFPPASRNMRRWTDDGKLTKGVVAVHSLNKPYN